MHQCQKHYFIISQKITVGVMSRCLRYIAYCLPFFCQMLTGNDTVMHHWIIRLICVWRMHKQYRSSVFSNRAVTERFSRKPTETNLERWLICSLLPNIIWFELCFVVAWWWSSGSGGSFPRQSWDFSSQQVKRSSAQSLSLSSQPRVQLLSYRHVGS